MEDRDVASSLLVTEVFTPSGHWSSYPPHRHDEDDFPNMTYLEETYYHRLNPSKGYGHQRVFTEDGSLDETMTVENHDVVLVPKGHHPCAVPYGYVIGNSRLNTGFFETFMRYLVGRDPDAHKFTLTNAAKDISYVNQMAHDAGMANLMSAAAKQYYMHATAIGAGDDYVPMLVDHIGKLNGINIQDEVTKGENDTKTTQ